MKLRACVVVTVLSAAVFPAGLPASHAQQAGAPKRVFNAAQLDPSDKSDLRLAQQIYHRLGDEVWPGFGGARIPMLVYNDAYHFLVGADRVPDGWEVVEGDDFDGRNYFRLASQSHSSFAVKVGNLWVGSMTCRARMNRDLPPGAVAFAMREDQWAVGAVHETFHAFQARASEKRFKRAQSVYSSQKLYPFDDQAFAAAWNEEGAALAAALGASNNEAAMESARRFLSLRQSRRTAVRLPGRLIDLERELEWLEGLGKYVEVRSYELAGENEQVATGGRFRGNASYQLDVSRLKTQLGRQREDLRFYLSGAAQARLLDRLSPGWKTNALAEDVFLEDLVKAVAAPRSDPR